MIIHNDFHSDNYHSRINRTTRKPMKILHLIEDLVGTVKTQKNYSGAFGRKPYNYNTEKKALGSGNFSSVKPDPHDPHLVKKHSKRVESSEDGYNIFIEYLINNNLMDNIHFPKIYNITNIKDKYGHSIHTYKLEKLIPFTDANSKELEAFMHKTFREDIIKHMIKQATMVGLRTPIVDAINDYLSWIAPLDSILDDSFVEAIKIIRTIESKNESSWIDNKSDNMMWRRTPHGLILVFTDPIA